MRIAPEDISPRLAAMLRKSGRLDLIACGFEIDSGALAASRALSPDQDHAIYHALFDRAAPHASTINPLPPPEPSSQAAVIAPHESIAALADAGEQHCERITGALVGRWKREDDTAEVREKSAVLWRRIHAALLLAILITLLAGKAHAQATSPLIMGAKAAGSVVANSKRQSGPYYIDCGASTTFTVATSTLNCSGSGGGTPGGTSGQIQYNGAGSFAGFTLSGDCTIVVATGVITCTKTNGSSFANVATSGAYADLTGKPAMTAGYYDPFGIIFNATNQAGGGGYGANVVGCTDHVWRVTDTPVNINAMQYGTDTGIHMAWGIYSAGSLLFQSATYTGTAVSNVVFSVAWASPTQLSAGSNYSICFSSDSGATAVLSFNGNYFPNMMNAGTTKYNFSSANPSSTAGSTVTMPATLGARTAISSSILAVVLTH